jgi:transcriptional repressor NrdR
VRSLQISLRKRGRCRACGKNGLGDRARTESGGGRKSHQAIGEIVMEHLRQLDDVAYVRFASVYRNFRET